MVTTYIFAKKDYVSKKSGTVPIYLGITQNRKVKPPISLNLKVDPAFWDDDIRRVKKGYPNFNSINAQLLEAEAKAIKIMERYRVLERSLTYERFIKEWGGIAPCDFEQYCQDYVNGLKGVHADSFVIKVNTVLKKISKYRAGLDLQDIDYKFIKDYYQYLLTKKIPNRKTTISTDFKIFKRVLKEAVKQDLIKKNPFESFPIQTFRTDRETLTLDEIRKLEELQKFKLPYYVNKTLCWFLLAVYTGRRFEDIMNFYNWEFSHDYIRIIQMKRVNRREERKITLVFMNQRIERIVKIIKTEKYEPLSNQKANAYLKEIIGRAGITKKITFHCSRHTFATINKSFKTDTYTNKELLGHDSINSTLIYEKIDNELLKEAMQKWNSI
jgi:integrase/recombinase XerD